MDIDTSAVSVVGGSEASPEEYAWAAEIGRLLALKGFTVVCGGCGGIMEAVCRGASGAGGRTVGILPGTDPAEANPWVGTPIVTGMGTSRNRIVALTGKAVIAVGGRYGTLSEIAFALQAGKRVCVKGTWSGIDGVTPVETPEEALEFVTAAIGGADAEPRGT